MTVADRLDALSYRGRRAVARRRVDAVNRFLPVRHECPCCGWAGRRFESYVQRSRRSSLSNEQCPRCGSHRRHRAFAVWLETQFGLVSRHGTALLVAPEASLHRLWDQAAGVSAVAIDVRGDRAIDAQADLRMLPLASGSVDIIWCHHVLEHIEHDRAAFHELVRVLKVGDGELLFSVPTRAGSTVENGFADPRDNGHWRTYGRDDLEALFREAGLDYERVVIELAPPLARRFHTGRPTFYRCTRLR